MLTAYPEVPSTATSTLDSLHQGYSPVAIFRPLKVNAQHTKNMDTPPEITLAEFRERYPLLFSDPSVDDIYCSRGWRDLLVSLCDTLQAHLDRNPDVLQVVVAQVKSKFGELHFFYDGGDDYCQGAVSLAEELSLKTCELCGAPGKQIGDRWVNTLCATHEERDKPGVAQ